MAKKKKIIETTTLSVVPENEKKSWVDVAFIQAGVYICVPSLMLGGMLVNGMGLASALIAGTIGYLLSGLIMSLVGAIGADLGTPTSVIAESSFGRSGARVLVSAIFAISQFGWFAVQNVVCGEAFSTMINSMFNIDFPVIISIAIWGIIMLSTAIQGIDGLKWLNTICVPLLFIVFVVGMVMAINKFGTGNLGDPAIGEPMTMVDGIFLTLSFLACGMTVAPDVTRYQRTRKSVFASSFVGLCPAGIILLIVGAILTKATGEYDISVVLLQAGLPAIGLIILILATWTTNTNNAYCAGISTVMMFNLKDEKRAVCTAICGAIGTVLAMLGFDAVISAFVDLLGVFFFPVAGIMLADYWIIRKGQPQNWKFVEKFNSAGVISWICGCVISYFAPYGLLIGFAASAAMYYVLYRAMKIDTHEVVANA